MPPVWWSPRDWTAGEVVTETMLDQQIRDNLTFLRNPPSAYAYSSASQSIANNTLTALTFNNERWDTDGLHDNVTFNNRVTCTQTGVYLLIAEVVWAANGTGNRSLAIYHNGTLLLRSTGLLPGTAAGTLAMEVTTMYSLAAGDYIEAMVSQTSGGALSTALSGATGASLIMHRLGGA